ERVDYDIPLGAERRLLERQRDRREEVRASLHPRPAAGRGAPPAPEATTEEHVEQVAHVAEGEEVSGSGRDPLRAEQVVLAAALRILEDVVRRGDLLESMLGLGVLVHV